MLSVPQYCHLTQTAGVNNDLGVNFRLENPLRFISCMLVILISLTVLLSGHGTVQAGSGSSGDGHHVVTIDVTKPVSHDPHSSHADICGMTVCGPYAEEQVSTALFMPVVTSVTYWAQDRTLVSAEADGSYKPPRA